MEVIDSRKKKEELFQLTNVITSIRKEFGEDVEIIEGEKPDFTIILPDRVKVGMEVTNCCPSEKKKGKGRIKDVVWTNKVVEAFSKSAYFLDVTKEQKLRVTIYGTSAISRGHNKIEDCCREIEMHLHKILESPKGIDEPTTLIRKVKVTNSPTANMVSFNYIGRRDAIEASELLKSLHAKEEKLKSYSSKLKDNCWLCVYLPWQEYRHPYDIHYDDNFTKEKFERELDKSNYKRIYVVSDGKPDLLIIKR